MKLNFFLLLCLTGIVSITQQTEYTLITTPMTWTEAKVYCLDMYEGLATVQTDPDWDNLNAEAERQGLQTTGWVGLHDRIDTWRWSHRNKYLGTSLSFWGPGQPDNAGSHELCTAINPDGYWEDYRCAELKPFICYNATIDENVAFPDLKSWGGSLGYCRKYHTDLANASSEAQNSELQQLAIQQNTSWLGLHRSEWAWASGQRVRHLRWASGFPNNINHNSYCVSVNNSLLMDRPCNSRFNFFCQLNYNMRKQELRLKIQAHKNVSDPHVQSAILQRIKEKLNEHGLSKDLKVNWKVRPNRDIFQKMRK